MLKENAGSAFVRATRYENMPEPSDLERGVPQPPVSGARPRIRGSLSFRALGR